MSNQVEMQSKDPREKLTKKEFSEAFHAYNTERDLYIAAVNLERFYRCELRHLRETKRKDLGTSPAGKVIDEAYLTALAEEQVGLSKKYRATMNVMGQNVAQLKPFIHARQWMRDWRK